MTESVAAAARTHLPEGVRIVVEPAVEEVPPVAADEAQLRQVLDNLLDNAIKYSPAVGRSGSASKSRRRRRFSVADGGLGIPAAERDRIFEKFYRLDPT
jgi:signal transduction histidine kinase